DPAVGERARGVDDARDARHSATEAVAITQVAQRNLDPRLAHLGCRLRAGQYAYRETPAPELLDHELAGLAGPTSDEDHDSPPFGSGAFTPIGPSPRPAYFAAPQ